MVGVIVRTSILSFELSKFAGSDERIERSRVDLLCWHCLAFKAVFYGYYCQLSGLPFKVGNSRGAQHATAHLEHLAFGLFILSN